MGWKTIDKYSSLGFLQSQRNHSISELAQTNSNEIHNNVLQSVVEYFQTRGR